MANKKISELPEAVAINRDELVEVVQGGVNKKVTTAIILAAAIKSDVGLDQVNNTSDADKPVSTDQATAIASAESDANDYTNTQIASLVFTDLNDVPSSYAGQSLKGIRTNMGETGLEFYTISGGGGTITLSGDVSGSGETSITTTIETNVVDDTNLRQSAGLSLVGRSANSTGNVADITAANDGQIVRRSGTSIGFGSIDLASPAAVGSSILPIANGGTGTDSQPWWALSGTSTLTGVATITSSVRNQHVFNGTWTSVANDDSHLTFSPSITADANSRTINALTIAPTMSAGAFINTVLNAVLITGRTVIKGLTTTNTAGTLLITDSAGSKLLDVADDGILRIGNNGSRPAISAGSGTAQTKVGAALWFSSQPTAGGFIFTGVSATGAGSINRTLQIVHTFTASADNATNTAINVIPTLNTTGTYVGPHTVLDYNPTRTSVTGLTEYGIVIRSGTVLNSFGAGATPTAIMHIGAGTSTRAQIKLDSTTILTTAVPGVVEYNGSHYNTKASGLRYGVGGPIVDFYTDVSNSGTSETDLYSYTTPINTLAVVGEKLIAEFTMISSDVTADSQYKIYFGGTQIYDSGSLATTTGTFNFKVTIIRTDASTARSTVSVLTNLTAGIAGPSVIQTDVTGLTFTNTNIIKITGQAGGTGGGTGDLTAKMGTINWYPSANN